MVIFGKKVQKRTIFIIVGTNCSCCPTNSSNEYTKTNKNHFYRGSASIKSIETYDT